MAVVEWQVKLAGPVMRGQSFQSTQVSHRDRSRDLVDVGLGNPIGIAFPNHMPSFKACRQKSSDESSTSSDAAQLPPVA